MADQRVILGNIATPESPPPSLALVPWQGSLVAVTRGWADLDERTCRLRAMEAARDYDLEKLLSLTEAHLCLHGMAGARVSGNTRRTYRTGIATFIEHARRNGWSLLRLPRDAGAMFLRQLEGSGLKPTTVATRRTAARALYKALRWAGAVRSGDPFENAKPARDTTPRGFRRLPFAEQEIQALLAHASPVEAVMVRLGADAGLRASEITSVRRQDVDLANRVLTITGKGGKPGRVVISNSLLKAIEALGPLAPDERLVPFSTARARYRMARLRERAGTRPFGLHSLRHRAGQRALEQTRDITVVAALLRHSDIATSAHYTRTTLDVTRAVVEGW